MQLTKRQVKNFYSKVEIDKNTGCWIWQASRFRTGYGQFKLNGRVVSAHRVSFMIATGRDPGKCFVLHSCDTKACVNPAHLCEGTHAENMLDKRMRLRASKKLTPSLVRVIRRTKGTLRNIARRHGISHVTVGQIKRRETWAHIT